MTREHKSLGNFVLCLIVLVLILLFINNRESLPSFNTSKNADTNLGYYEDNPNSNSSKDNMSINIILLDIVEILTLDIIIDIYKKYGTFCGSLF